MAMRPAAAEVKSKVMRRHSTVGSYGGQGTPRRGRRARCVALVACAALLASGCAAGSGRDASPAPTTADDAFRTAHPYGALPPALKRSADASRAAALLAGRSGAGRVVLPAWLPEGYGLAAPYVSVGSGAVLPNPQVWDGGYRVSYTDGDGLIVLHVGSGRLPGQGVWQPLDRRWRGASLSARSAGGVTAVAALGGGTRVAVAVVGAPPATAARVLTSVAPQR